MCRRMAGVALSASSAARWKPWQLPSQPGSEALTGVDDQFAMVL